MFKVLFIIFMSLSSFQVAAEELFVVINGKAIHEGSGNYNEDNWGLGFEYDLKQDDKWIPFVAGSRFKDSNSNMSTYLGGGYKYRIPFDSKKDGWRVDLSLIAFMMTRKDYNNNEPFIGALPFIGIGTGNVMLNMTYIPQVTPKTVGLLYFQLKFKVIEFD